MQKQTFIFVKVSVGVTISYSPRPPPPPLVKQAKKKARTFIVNNSNVAPDVVCVGFCCSLPLSSISFCAIQRAGMGGGGGNVFATRDQHATAAQRKGVGQTGLIYFGSASKVRKEEEFGELSTEH